MPDGHRQRLQEELTGLGHRARSQSGKKAASLLKRMARKAGFTIQSGGKHLKVTNPATGRTVTHIPHAPRARPTIEAIVRAIMEAAGFHP